MTTTTTEAQRLTTELAQQAARWPTVIRAVATNYKGLDALTNKNRQDGSLPLFADVVIPDGYTIAAATLWGRFVLALTLHATI